MQHSSKIISSFSIGPLIPVNGMDGERIVVSGENVAVVSSAQAMWTSNDEVLKLNLPYVNTQNARWTHDGNQLCIGMGKINVKERKWDQHQGLQKINQYAKDGSLSRKLISACWNSLGTYVAALVEEANTQTVQIYELNANDPVSSFHVQVAENIVIVNDHIVVLAPQVSVWTYKGLPIKIFTETRSGIFRARMDVNENRMALLYNDWSIVILDIRTWDIVSTGKGIFHDVALNSETIIALDLDGNLHAACLNDAELFFSKEVNTGLLINQIAIGDDDHLFTMGSGPTAVHKTRYSISCTE